MIRILGRHRAGQLARGRRAARAGPAPVFTETGTIGRAGQEGVRDRASHVVADQLEPVGLGEVGLGQRHEAGLDAQELADREVLAGLRHHALVGGDDQQREVDAARAGQHVLDEALVAGHVDDLDHEPARLLEEGEAEVDGDAARLLLGQPVGVGAGQRLDQRRLAVVDVAGGADDDVAHGSRALEGGEAGRERRHLGRQHGPAVEQEPVVEHASEHGRAARPQRLRRAPRRGGAARAERERRGGQLHGGQRPAADLRASTRPPARRGARRLGGPRRPSTRRARCADRRRSGSVSMRRVGIVGERGPRLVGVERGLQRRDRELVDPQRPVQRVAREALDQLARARPRCRPAARPGACRPRTRRGRRRRPPPRAPSARTGTRDA